MLPVPLLVSLGFFVKEFRISLGNITSSTFTPSTCSCKRADGRIINLEPLQSTEPGKPRFSVRDRYGYNISYNPCFPFKLGPAGGSDSHCQNDVALCWSSAQVHFYHTVGTQSSERCDTTTPDKPQLVYHHSPQGAESKKSYVILHCDPTRTSVSDALFQVIDIDYWKFSLTHSACCWTTATPSPSPSSSVEPVTMVTHKTSPSPDDGNTTLEVSTISAGAVVFIAVAFFYLWQRKKRNDRERQGLLVQEPDVIDPNAGDNDLEPRRNSPEPGSNVSQARNLPSPYQSNHYNDFFDIKYDKTEINSSLDRDVNKTPV